MKKVFEIADG